MADPYGFGEPYESKQTKRLNLRRNGFRATALTERNITPKRTADFASDPRSRAGSLNSPHHDHLRPLASLLNDDDHNASALTGMGILQQVSNSSQRRKKSSARARIDDVSIFEDENTSAPAAYLSELPSELPFITKSPRHGSLPRSASNLLNRTLGNHKRKVSAHTLETTKYIEHLESELGAAQTQLATMTSPTVMQNRSLKMKALNIQVKDLQAEVTHWEAKYNERVNQEVADRIKLETGLKKKIRGLEDDVANYARKVRDMQLQLDRRAAAVTAAELANCELEKRIDAITNLVASPQKNNRHSFGFGNYNHNNGGSSNNNACSRDSTERDPSTTRKSRHERQRSVLPRFLTTGNLTLPPRTCEPVEPSTPVPPQGPDAALLALTGGIPDRVSSHTIGLSVANLAHHRTSVATEYPSAELNPPGSSSSSNHYSWSTPDSSVAGEPVVFAGRQGRRMRRFHGGTMMPKPLLLPCTTTMSYNSENQMTPPASYPFPALAETVELPTKRPFEALLTSPPQGVARKRALTSADGLLMALRRASSPFAGDAKASSPADPPQLASPADLTRNSSGSSGSSGSGKTLRDLSSVGSMAGRNLFEELRRAKAQGRAGADDLDSKCSLSFEDSKRALRSVSGSTRSMSGGETSVAIQDGLRRRGHHRRSLSDQVLHIPYPSDDAKTDITSLITDVIRHPFTTAKHAMVRAHILSTRSPTMQKLQWWMLNALMGPMDARRMMTGPTMKRASSTVGLAHYSACESRSVSTTSSASIINKRTRRADNADVTICLSDPSHEHDARRASNGDMHRGSVDVLDGSTVLCTSTTTTTTTQTQTQTHQQIINVHRSNFGESQRFDALFFGRHSLWLWLRFSFTLAFAIGAALREGPGVILGVQRIGQVQG